MKKIIIFVGIFVGVILGVVVFVLFLRGNQAEEYKAINYALKGTNFSLESVDVVDGHVIYILIGEDNYQKVKKRYEEYLELHNESTLYHCPIEIFFYNTITNTTAFGIANFIPEEMTNSSLYLRPNESGIHDELDVTILSLFWQDDKYITIASNNVGTKYLIVNLSEKSGEYVASIFNKTIDLFLPSYYFNDEDMKIFEENFLKILPNCCVNGMEWIYCKTAQ